MANQRISKPWWYPWGEAEWLRDPRSRGWVSKERGVWEAPTYAPSAVTAKLSYEEFLRLATEDPEEFRRIVTDPTGVALPEVTATGYDWRWGFTPEGGYVWELYDRATEEKAEAQAGLTQQMLLTPEPMSEYQRGQLELAQKQAERDWTYRQYQMRPTEEAPELPPEQVFEAYRQQALGGLAGPRNWIRRWQIEHMISPYTEWKESARRARKEQWIAKTPVETLMETAPGQRPIVRGTPQEPLGYVPTAAEEASYRQARLGAVKGRGVPEEPEKAPPTPGWLTQFAPGLTAGETLTKQPVGTISGQAWARTPYSQREKLAGYMGWAGQSYQDMLEAMARARPAAPVGATRPTWIPARQWA